MTSLSVCPMPRKREYSVVWQNPDKLGGANDSYFAACLTSLLVFLAMCVIIVLATHPWKSNKWSNKQSNHGEGGAFDRHRSGRFPQNSSTTSRPHSSSTEKDYGDQNPDDEVEKYDEGNDNNETTIEPSIGARNDVVGDASIPTIELTQETQTTRKSERSGKALFTGELTSSTPVSTVPRDAFDDSTTTTNEPQSELTLLTKLVSSSTTLTESPTTTHETGAPTTTQIITTTAVSNTEPDQQDTTSTSAPASLTEGETNATLSTLPQDDALDDSTTTTAKPQSESMLFTKLVSSSSTLNESSTTTQETGAPTTKKITTTTATTTDVVSNTWPDKTSTSAPVSLTKGDWFDEKALFTDEMMSNAPLSTVPQDDGLNYSTTITNKPQTVSTLLTVLVSAASTSTESLTTTKTTGATVTTTPMLQTTAVASITEPSQQDDISSSTTESIREAEYSLVILMDSN